MLAAVPWRPHSARRRFQLAFRINQEVGRRHHAVGRGQAVQDLHSAGDLAADVHLARLEPSVRMVQEHELALAHRQLTRARQVDAAEVLAERAGHLAQLFPVAFVVMGHTHVPAQLSVAASTTYINVGAWAEEEPNGEDGKRHRAPRTHLVIHRGEHGPVADLLAWDAIASAPKRFVSG